MRLVQQLRRPLGQEAAAAALRLLTGLAASPGAAPGSGHVMRAAA